jgi:hypothetical protein
VLISLTEVTLVHFAIAEPSEATGTGGALNATSSEAETA